MILLNTYRCRRWHQLWIGVVALLLFYWGTPIRPLAAAALRPEVGTRALGMSGAFISNADDPTGALWNPAGLAHLQKASFIYDFSQGAFSFGYPIDKFGTLGFSLLDLNRDDRFFIKRPGNPIGTFERGYNQAILSYARVFGESWRVGGNIGYSRAPYIGSRWKPSYDLGVILEMNSHLTIGASLLDISGVAIPDEQNRILTTFDQEFALGATWEPVRHFQLNSALDTAPWQFRTGVEAGVSGLALRVGSVLDLKQHNRLPNWSLGFSVDHWGKQIHYAYLDDPDLKYKHLLSVGFQFGTPAKIGDGRSDPIPQSPVSENTANESQSIGTQNEEKPNKEKPRKREQQVVKTKSKDTASPTDQIAQQYGIEPELILALVEAESSFNSNAISIHGAVGLMQLKPLTAQELGLVVPNYPDERNPIAQPDVDERFHQLKNLEAGVKYLSQMMERYDGHYIFALAAYNGGPGKVQKDAPLLSQIERNVGKVLDNYYQYKADPQLTEATRQQLNAILMNSPDIKN